MSLQEIPFKLLMTSSLNPRVVDPGPEKLASLAASIEAEGLLENIVVRPSPIQAGRFELIAGHTRCRAFQLLIEQGKRSDEDSLPARVKDPCSDLELVTLAMTENCQRNDLHPLDEAEGFARLRELGMKPEEIAASLPYTTRLVQLRLQLADNLTAETKKAFREGAFNLQSARILAASCPPARQAAVVERIKAGDYKYDTPAELQMTLRDEAVPLAHALFEREDYQGPVQVDTPEVNEEDSGFEVEEDTELAADLEEFWRLQNEVIEARRAELARSWSDCKIVREGYWQPYHDQLEAGCKDKSKAIAVLHVMPDGQVKEYTGLVKRGTAEASGRGKPKPLQKGKDSGKTAAELAAESGENTLPTEAGRVMAQHAKTRALRAAMLRAGAPAAMIATIIALMGCRTPARLSYDLSYSREDAVEAPEVEAVFTKFRPRLKRFLCASPTATPGSARRLQADFNEEKRAALYRELVSWPAEDVEALFTALVAASVGSYPGSGLGDAPVAVAMAEHLQPDVAAVWQLDESYAKTLKKAGLVRALDDMGIDVEAEGLAGKKVGELVDTVVHISKAVTTPYLPPLFHFGSEADVRKWIRPGATPPTVTPGRDPGVQATPAAKKKHAPGRPKAKTRGKAAKKAVAKPAKKGSRRDQLAKKEEAA